MENQRKKRIIVESATKKFDIGYKGGEGALAKIVSMFSGREYKKNLVAINDVSFEADEGEVIGIIGKNGSGKSTLLRLIAGIYEPDAGRIATEGGVMYINGFNHATKPRLTMRENIFLAGAVLGLRPNEIKSKFSEIVDFSGLHEYIDTKVYQFSSGMLARLNFSIFIHSVDTRAPDILLLDEVLSAGGDLDFKNKAELKIQELIKCGATVFLASHLLSDIEKHCDRVLWIENGVLVEDGKSIDMIARYKSSFI